jgi:hypothetical protein
METHLHPKNSIPSGEHQHSTLRSGIISSLQRILSATLPLDSHSFLKVFLPAVNHEIRLSSSLVASHTPHLTGPAPGRKSVAAASSLSLSFQSNPYISSVECLSWRYMTSLTILPHSRCNPDKISTIRQIMPYYCHIAAISLPYYCPTTAPAAGLTEFSGLSGTVATVTGWNSDDNLVLPWRKWLLRCACNREAAISIYILCVLIPCNKVISSNHRAVVVSSAIPNLCSSLLTWPS